MGRMPQPLNVHVSTLQILEKRFKPEEARAIAEAIDDAMEDRIGPGRLVTEDSLKVQLAETEARLNLETTVRIAELETRLFTKMVVLGLSGTGLIITSVFFMVLNLKK